MIFVLEKNDWQFEQDGIQYVARYRIALGLKRLREEIQIKLNTMVDDKSRYVYYEEITSSLQKDFNRRVREGLRAGSIFMLNNNAPDDKINKEVA